MPEVISNTSPLQYLHQVGLLHLLPAMYGQVVVPEAVAQELGRGVSLGIALPDLDTLPWLRIARVGSTAALASLSDVGPGEREVLALALETPTALVVLDDARARRHAGRLGITLTGTLGVLLKAKQKGHLEALRPVLDRLEQLHFYLDAPTTVALLRLANE